METRKIHKTCSPVEIKKMCIPIILGQLLAILISLTAICSGVLVQFKINLPLAINFPHYVLLTVFYGIPYLCYNIYRKFHRLENNNIASTEDSFNHDAEKSTVDEYSAVTDIGQTVISPSPRKQFVKTLIIRLSLYSLVGVIDVHANWSIVSAYAYTSVTSIQLLDCITIPTVVLLSYYFLFYRYTWNHYTAIILCLIGATGMILTDYFLQSSNIIFNNDNVAGAPLDQTAINDQSFTAEQMIFGDFLVIIGAILYGLSNVLQQYLIVKYGIVEFLSCVGLVASIVTVIYTVLIERQSISMLMLWTDDAFVNFDKITACFIGYALSMFALYSLMPLVLMRSSAVLVNLSLLTSDIYAVLMGVFIFYYKFHYLYILCFLVILFGVGLFNIHSPNIVAASKRKLNCF
ncbi:Solute carrier family 35 member F1 [Schistosoma japonicum]|uniref:Solute carrier family 35 member F1 n=1 Tax=Schistosoma japonicum TaxID=6182 RepID=C1L3N5_SCHJA|nr:Solute carrier family 35 member F1 [Schistosoma japonicum]CAX69313.1 Protein of unknown function DUF914, eukaryotic,domain-containing protein [Schistosoma japonicum]